MSWTFHNAWNLALETREERPVKPRTNLWASELGKSPCDLFLKLKGVPPTNPPDCRALRKFEAGNVMEWVVELVLTRSGILQTKQDWLSYQYPGLLEVTGKLDFTAGGVPDPSKLDYLEKVGMPEIFVKGGRKIVEHLSTKYPDGLEDIILEVKSCSAFMFENYERSGTASDNHVLQLFHYLKATGMDVGHIVYISKDDLRMLEIEIRRDDEEIEKVYKRHIEVITEAIKKDEQPPLEPLIVFNSEFMRFSDNWKVRYSDYLKLLYNYENQGDFFDEFRPQVEKMNRVLKRIATGKNLTDANMEIWRGAEKYFTPNELDQIVSLTKEKQDKEVIFNESK